MIDTAGKSGTASPLAALAFGPEASHTMPGEAERVHFFIAGVQKGGTTALDSVLRDHPSIEMARVKEVHYFDDDAVDWSALDHGRLHAAYDWAVVGGVRGEATPITLYWPNALERLRCYNPRAKLLIGLRNPAFRAFSHWRMETKRAGRACRSDRLSGLRAASASGMRRAGCTACSPTSSVVYMHFRSSVF